MQTQMRVVRLGFVRVEFIYVQKRALSFDPGRLSELYVLCPDAVFVFLAAF